MGKLTVMRSTLLGLSAWSARRWLALWIVFSSCRGDPPVVCGDGVLREGEACDDGNTLDGDGCSAACALELGFSCQDGMCTAICGDGLVRAGEACDEGPKNGTGCTEQCEVRPGFSCGGEGPGTCWRPCGDGRVSSQEACDDGNTADGDGCSTTCAFESGFSCTSSIPTVCEAICGDGLIVGPETCDDGNTGAGDGCDPRCVARLAWRPLPNVEPPEPRSDAAMTWTGTELFIWGGASDRDLVSGGHLYEPSNRAWRAVDNAGAPSPRIGAACVFTGSEVLVFGGRGVGTWQDGGRYDPRTDTWRPMAVADAPTPRYAVPGVWTGRELIVFGGYEVPRWGAEGVSVAGGGAYDPSTDTWRALSEVNAPSARGDHTIVWTGHELIVFGGRGLSGAALSEGAAYDPARDTWRPLPSAGAPSPRYGHAAVWAGHEMLVLGGENGSSTYADGAAYDPETDAWRPIASRPVSQASSYHVAFWTGSEVLVWGGLSENRRPAKYIPATDRWVDLSTDGAPAWRGGPSAALSAHAIFILGGWMSDGNGRYRVAPNGGVFSLETGTWAPLVTSDPIEGRTGHAAAGIGSQLMIWGGGSQDTVSLDSGFVWDISRGTRRPTSRINAPSPRVEAAGVATDRELFIFGGKTTNRDEISLGDGATYDPSADRWTPLPLSGAPTPRTGHTAVFTGTEILIFGGRSRLTAFGDGARFNVTTRLWTPLSPTADSPTPRFQHAALWTGSELVVFGGSDGFRYLGTGARFDPVLERWRPLPREGAPTPRAYHSAVWTGAELIVFGGFDGRELRGDGARYDLAADRWTPLPTMGAPSPRAGHSATWTGSQMVVFGGNTNARTGAVTNDGARYDPRLDAWLPLPTLRAPVPRDGHSAVWMGSEIAIFGGVGESAASDGAGIVLGDGVLLDL